MTRRGRRRPALVVGLALAVVVTSAAACTDSGEGSSTRPSTGSERGQAGSAIGITRPEIGGAALLGPGGPAGGPEMRPAQAASNLAGRPLPTTQWWTSALTGPWTQPLWAFPVVARAGPDGFELAAPRPTAGANAVISPFTPALKVGGALQSVEVADFGDFSVELDLRTAHGPVIRAVVAQGSPLVYVSAPAGPLRVGLVSGAVVESDDGIPVALGTTARTDHLRMETGGEEWDLFSSAPVSWSRDGDRLEAQLAEPLQIALAPRPEGADAGWAGHARDSASRPILTSRSELTTRPEAGVARQTLTWARPGSEAGLVALLPHQRLAVQGAPQPVAGRYPTPRGDLTVVRAATVELAAPLTGFLPGVPPLEISPEERAAFATDLAADDKATILSGGSYFGAKALGRLATLVEVAERVGGDPAIRAGLTESLRSGLVDWLTYTGPGDRRWLTYDEIWGGLLAVPPEFGNQNYIDHHFHYGYLLQAAATLAAVDDQFVAQYGEAVDLMAADLLGSAAAGAAPGSFPPFRVFNDYQGHSHAVGFAPQIDGNNQESSSEAVHAWAGVARWGLVADRPKLVEAGLSRYAVEALAARVYWLGELGDERPEGYEHEVVGIVWGGKVDFATFFDPRPEAVIGIQLLPTSFNSFYRADPAAARRRWEEASAAAQGLPRLWPDLFVMDAALFDPAGAAAKLTPEVPIEEGNSRAFARYWLAFLTRIGQPSTGIRADAPYGRAFDGPSGVRYVGINPTTKPVTVSFFRADGAGLGVMTLAPGEARTVATL